MDRIIVNQALLDAAANARYLEIGVNSGNSFIPIRAARKWGVDPAYTLSRKRRAKYAVFSALHLKTERLFRMTSDAFFASKRRMLARQGIDVCFVDGLHTYEQSLRDVVNALEYLKPDGVIVMHDCNPTSAVAAHPARSIDEVIALRVPGWTGAWSGDVWKTIVHLRSLRRDLRAFVLDCYTGVGIVTRELAPELLPITEADIQALDYRALETDRHRLLDLQPPEYFDTFLRERLRGRDAAS